MVKAIASLQSVQDDVSGQDLSTAADQLSTAGSVYLLGQLHSAPVVDSLSYMLTKIGMKYSSGGLATHMAGTIPVDDVLVAVSFRYYAIEVVSISENLKGAGTNVVAIEDSTLSPLEKSADALLVGPENRHTLSWSIAAPMCISQALVLATAARLQVDADLPEIPTVTRA